MLGEHHEEFFMIEEWMGSRWGGYMVMAVLLGGVALLLRFLYGPHGILRDPRWDEENRRIRAEEEAERQARKERFQLDMQYPPARDISLSPERLLSFDEHCSLFRSYAANFITNRTEDAPIRLKEAHSLRVYTHVENIVRTEHLPDDIARAGLLAGLYHDCGRFPQFCQYRTFVDAASVNHAHLSLKVLKKKGFLIGETPRVRALAQTAVLLHNRSVLPERLTPDARLVTDMVRDADKLDIISIMVAHFEQALPENDAVFLHVQNRPEACSPTVIRDVLAGRVVSYRDLHYVNDFRLLLGTWAHELRFPITRKMLRASGHLEKVFSGLPDTPEIRASVAFLRGVLNEAPQETAVSGGSRRVSR